MDHDNIKLALWDYYNRDKSVGIIVGKAKIYKHFGHLDLESHAFPVPLEVIIAIGVRGVMQGAGVEDESMKVQIFLRVTGFLFGLHHTELSK